MGSVVVILIVMVLYYAVFVFTVHIKTMHRVLYVFYESENLFLFFYHKYIFKNPRAYALDPKKPW